MTFASPFQLPDPPQPRNRARLMQCVCHNQEHATQMEALRMDPETPWRATMRKMGLE